MGFFKLPQEKGESMVQYYNRILDIADEWDLNNITQQEIMAMVFISPLPLHPVPKRTETTWSGSDMAVHP